MKSPLNKTIFFEDIKNKKLINKCVPYHKRKSVLENAIIHGNCYEWLKKLEKRSFDLIIVDPPYNMTKTFGNYTFTKQSNSSYQKWIEEWIFLLYELLKDNGTIYICCDWKCSSNFYNILSKLFYIQNRITWERDKGRGSKKNWKNCSEDIWFATKDKEYTFNVENVKHKKRVIAPYKKDGNPKDWKSTKEGNFRLTHPSNLWSDITVPFWSMEENTEHPTQKPEKLIAKLILASSNRGDWVLDPFAGVGTVPVVCKKLNRHYIGIEQSLEYCSITQFRLENAKINKNIQGYESYEEQMFFSKQR